YTINVYALDAAGNQQPAATSGFSWDKTDPVSNVVVPFDGAFIRAGGLTLITGTANDANDIFKVELSIQRLSDSKYWDTGINDWSTSGSPLYLGTPATINPPAGVHPRVWQQSAALPPDNKLTPDELYNIRARATDVPGNIQVTIS